MIEIKRRDFIILFGSIGLASQVARAQQNRKPARIVVISTGPSNPVGTHQGLVAGLYELGFVEGENLIIQHVPVGQPAPVLLAAVTELVKSNPDLLVALGPEAALEAATSATKMIPIVMVATNYDPISRGYIKSLSHPGGNITGISGQQLELAEKQVALLAEIFPERTRLAMLWDELSSDQFKAADYRARSLGLELNELKLESPPYDFPEAFATLARGAPQMLIVLSSPHFTSSRKHIAQLALNYGWPSMFIFRTYGNTE